MRWFKWNCPEDGNGPRDFRVGDVVVVGSNYGWSGRRVDPARHTIMRVHKGNGNLIVDGKQYTLSGWSCSGGQFLLIAGSEEHKRIVSEQLTAEAFARVRAHLRKLSASDFTLDALRSIERVLDHERQRRKREAADD